MNTDIRQLCDILAALGVSEGADLVAGLNIGAYLGHPEGLQLLAAGERRQLGELLQAARRLTAEQLEDALAEQKRSGARIGEILMQRGLLSKAECAVVLAFQQRRTGQACNATKLYLGNVLVATRQITQAQLADALLWQSSHGGRLGEALIAAGHVSARQVHNGVQLQRTLVAAVLLAALALAAPFSGGDAQASNRSPGAQVSSGFGAGTHMPAHRGSLVTVFGGRI